MPHVNLMFPSKYLKGADVLEAGGMVVTIARVESKALRRDDGSTEQCWIASLRETDKLWVLSATTGNQIADLYGKRNSDDWPGLRVRLTTEHGRWFGKETDAIRVSPRKPPQQQQRTAPPAETKPPPPPSFSPRLKWYGLEAWGGKPLADAPAAMLTEYGTALEMALGGVTNEKKADAMRAHIDEVKAALATQLEAEATT